MKPSVNLSEWGALPGSGTACGRLTRDSDRTPCYAPDRGMDYRRPSPGEPQAVLALPPSRRPDMVRVAMGGQGPAAGATNRLKIKTQFWPPNANELDIAVWTVRLRA